MAWSKSHYKLNMGSGYNIDRERWRMKPQWKRIVGFNRDKLLKRLSMLSWIRTTSSENTNLCCGRVLDLLVFFCREVVKNVGGILKWKKILWNRRCVGYGPAHSNGKTVVFPTSRKGARDRYILRRGRPGGLQLHLVATLGHGSQAEAARPNHDPYTL